MDSAKKFSLQWNEYKTSINKTFGGLRKTGDYSDVTLACEDGQQIEAHRVVLSSSCLLFSELLKKNPHSHPLVYMRGVKHQDLSAIIDFIYLGETEVMKENLETFLEIAGELGVQGMTRQNSKKPSEDRLTTNSFGSELVENYSGVDGLVNTQKDQKFIQREQQVDNVDRNAKASFECNACGTYCSTKDLLTNHKKKHIEKAERFIPLVGIKKESNIASTKKLVETMDYLCTDAEEMQEEEVGEDVEEDKLQDEEELEVELQNDTQLDEEHQLEDERSQEIELQEEVQEDEDLLQEINKLNYRKPSDDSSADDSCHCDLCGNTFDNSRLLITHKYREHIKIEQQ